jgi:hypothetical protein
MGAGLLLLACVVGVIFLMGDSSACAVVFPAASLDPEPVAAAQTYFGGDWIALSRLPAITDGRLAELQAGAVSHNNAVLREDGLLEPFS